MRFFCELEDYTGNSLLEMADLKRGQADFPRCAIWVDGQHSFFFFNVYLVLRERERERHTHTHTQRETQSVSRGGAEREGDTESKAGSRL